MAIVNQLKWKKYHPLSDKNAFICLVDVMGADNAIVQAARASYDGFAQGLKISNKAIAKVNKEGFNFNLASDVVAIDNRPDMDGYPEVFIVYFEDPSIRPVEIFFSSPIYQALVRLKQVQIEEDRHLTRYLMNHSHTTPFEMVTVKFMVQVPMDCWRQWVRHRTACLTGDTELVFERPCDGKAYRMSISEVYDKFQPTENATRPDKQKNAFFKRERVQAMNLRCLDENQLVPSITKIVDIWQTGIKQVFKVTTTNGETIRCSEDHLIHTPFGWFKLKDLGIGASISTIRSNISKVVPKLNDIDESLEEWVPIRNWEDYYEISSQGRVRRIVGGKGSRSHGRCKKITINNGRASVSLNRPGEQIVVRIHREMLLSFNILPDYPEQTHVCHNDGNSLNNTLDNLRWGTPMENSTDTIEHGRSTKLSYVVTNISSIIPDGKEMTYDIEVEGPYHNFSANDIVVHNSINEYSTRYMEALDFFQVTEPTEWRLQSTDNKQGSSGFLTEWPENEEDSPKTREWTAGEWLSDQERLFQKVAIDLYQKRIALGVAKEQARKDLPLSTYTRAYWQCNLHNIFHFLRLRMDSHAQLEIRSFANVMFEIIKQICPVACEAFEDYVLHAKRFSRMEMEIIRTYFHLQNFSQDVQTNSIQKPSSMTYREWKEFIAKVS